MFFFSLKHIYSTSDFEKINKKNRWGRKKFIFKQIEQWYRNDMKKMHLSAFQKRKHKKNQCQHDLKTEFSILDSEFS